MASQIAIKQLGTNGGGFFNMNSAHPFENPAPFNNFVEMWAILIIPFAFAFTFGEWSRTSARATPCSPSCSIVWLGVRDRGRCFEANGNPKLDRGGATRRSTVDQAGGNMEGKEVRFGPGGVRAVGGVDDRHVERLGQLHARQLHAARRHGRARHMMLGEVSPGGVGVGLSGLLIMAILSVFIAGLMVGRTPEYLGKKIQAAEMKLVALYILAMPAIVLVFVAVATFVGSVKNVTIWNPGPHGFTEILYAFTSAANNNGSAFAGITATTAWMDTTMGIAMLIGRFFLIIPSWPSPARSSASGACPPRGHVPDPHPAVRRPRHRRRRHRRWAHLLPGTGARPHRRAPDDLIRGAVDRMARETPSCVEPAIVRRAIVDSFVKLNPRTLMRNPVMFVVCVGSVLTTILFFRDLGSSTTNENVFAGLVAAVAVVHRAVRQLRRGDGRRPRQGAGRHAAQDPGRDHGQPCGGPTAASRRCPSSQLTSATCAS